MILLTYGAARSALVLLVLCLHTFVLVTVPTGYKLYKIYWNSSNPMFRSSNTDTVNRNNSKFHYDQVNLICPVYTSGTREDDMEKYMIYHISKDEYDKCQITNPYPQLVALCNKPYKLVFFTITFRPFSPIPGGLEFLPGHDYYFISTSLDLYRNCTTHNMKIVFKVWPPPTDATTRATTSFCQLMWYSISLFGVSRAEAVLLVIIAVASVVIIVGIILLLNNDNNY